MLVEQVDLNPTLVAPGEFFVRPESTFVDADSLHPASIPPLRDPIRVEVPVNAVDVSPNPGAMGELYIKMREVYPDGMSLACARPKNMPYEEIVQKYIGDKEDPEFDAFAFWEEQFETPSPEDGVVTAEAGETLEAYWNKVRPNFIRPKDQNGAFDIELPYDRSVAGAGRFGFQSFLWDGYQMTKGYGVDGQWEKVLDVVDNTEYQINLLDHSANGSAWFLATRAHPPYFSNMVSQLADGPYGEKALVRYLPAMEKEYQGYWMDGKEHLESLPDDGETHEYRNLVRVPLGDGKFAYLNHYSDDAKGPRLESYKEDFELGESVLKLEKLEDAPEEVKEARLEKLYADIRAGAASGWDFSSRWLKDGINMESINTTDILPIDLNSLMARTELVLARAHRAAGNYEQAREYVKLAQSRIEAINTLMWDKDEKLFRDYDYQFRDDDHPLGKQTDVISSATAYPLYVGITDVEQTFGVMRAIDKHLLFEGGIIATNNPHSNQQWEGGIRLPDGTILGHGNVWAPPNWAAARGVARMAHMFMEAGVEVDVEPLLDAAERYRAAYMHGIREVFAEHRMVTEKHRGDQPRKLSKGGEYALVKVLAMPGETYRALEAWNPRDPKGTLPIGRTAIQYLVSLN